MSDDLARRIAELERRVQQLEAHSGDAPARPQPPPLPPPPPVVRHAPPAVGAAPRTPRASGPPNPAERLAERLGAWQTEQWLTRLGIGLLLFGLAFLFRYSIDAGYLTPPIRVAGGVALGLSLLGAAWRLPARQSYALMLLGGGLACLYATGFAAYFLYGLVAYAPAFVYMSSVTLLAIGLALRERAEILAVIGLSGGLATPFLLYRESGEPVALALYALVLSIAGAALYLRRAWRHVYWTYAGLAAIVLVIAAYGAQEEGATGSRWAVQAVLAGWLACAWVPPLRRSTAGLRPGDAAADSYRGSPLPALVAAFALPLAFWVQTCALWWPSADGAGALALLSAGLAGGIAAMRPRLRPAVADSHAVAAAGMLVLGVALIATWAATVLAAMLVSCALLGLGRHEKRATLRSAGIAGAGAAALAASGWLLAIATDVEPFTLAQAIPTLAALVAGTYPLARTERGTAERMWLALLLHGGMLLWLVDLSELLGAGQAGASALWGLYAVGLLWAALRERDDALRTLALATLALLVAKLFLLDMSQVDAVVRIVLFMGLGAAFLAFGFLLPHRWRAGWAPDAEPPEGAAGA